VVAVGLNARRCLTSILPDACRLERIAVAYTVPLLPEADDDFGLYDRLLEYLERR